MFGLELPFYSPLYKGARNATRLRKGWAKGTSAADLTIPGSGRKILVPKLTQIAIASETGSEVTALVDMATVGGTARDLESKIETVTASLHGSRSYICTLCFRECDSHQECTTLLRYHVGIWTEN